MPEAAGIEFGAFQYETESAFAEVAAFSSPVRLLTSGPIDLSGIRQDKIPVNPTKQRPSEGVPDVLGVFGGSFRVRFPLTGRGATGTSLAVTELATFMGHMIGTLNSASVGAVITTGTSATQFTATGVNMPNGALCRVGVIGDGRGNGQAYAVSGESSDVVTLLTAMSATPTPTTDTCFPMLVVHPSETPGTFDVPTSIRCQLFTANRQLDVHGCYPMNCRFVQLGPTEAPFFEVELGIARPALANRTFPSAVATNAKQPAVNAGGSLFLQQVGTATRQAYAVRSLEFTPGHTCVGVPGQHGLPSANQGLSMCRRRPGVHKLRVTVDAETTGSEVWVSRFQEETRREHILYTASAEDGQALAFYWPQCKYTGTFPPQRELEGLNRIDLEFECETGPTTTADLIASAYRVAMG